MIVHRSRGPLWKVILEIIGGCIYVALAWMWWVLWGRRASQIEECILELLAAAPGPMYGLDLVNQSGGKLKRGTVYVWLSRMVEGGLVFVASREVDGRTRYAITDAGRLAVHSPQREPK